MGAPPDVDQVGAEWYGAIDKAENPLISDGVAEAAGFVVGEELFVTPKPMDEARDYDCGSV